MTDWAIHALQQLGKGVNVFALIPCAANGGAPFPRYKSAQRGGKSFTLELGLSTRHGSDVFLYLLRRLVILKFTKQEVALHVQYLVVAGRKIRILKMGSRHHPTGGELTTR